PGRSGARSKRHRRAQDRRRVGRRHAPVRRDARHARRSEAVIRTLLLLLALLAAPALAHKPSDAYLTIERDGDAISGRFDLALRDLDNALTLDANGDGAITWGEVRAKHEAVDAYVLERVALASGGERCAMSVVDHALDTHTDGTYAVLTLAGRCARAGPT